MTEPMVHTSTFPPPPPFYSLYTKDGITSQPLLLEPPPPLSGSFIKFGAVQSDDFLVHDLGNTPQLYDSNESVSRSLRHLCKSIAQTFIELLDALLDKQSQLQDRLSHLRCLFINVSHILNKLRAHQARQTIILLLQKQIKARRQRISQLQTQTEKAKDFLAAHGLANDSMVIEPLEQPITSSLKVTEPNYSNTRSSRENEHQSLLSELYGIWGH